METAVVFLNLLGETLCVKTTDTSMEIDWACFHADKALPSQSYGFSSHVCMWELGCKEDWVPKNWCFQIVVLEKTLESPLDFKEIKQVNPKGNQPWMRWLDSITNSRDKNVHKLQEIVEDRGAWRATVLGVTKS